ncbi:peptidoglycan-binding domain-containing protein [Nannocystis bainbridge]|uniref:Peptidoglycan-binding domain-containing protein n=1 Tax=Nannocystis bainbridge TaxID=2995303 RepID=A0ABT5DT76_9BACT|nr:peptidoglycan-binding domain-containing protein [Nannocystis bainbridge]MDC0716845.1 peptidoglycan-binding domain-containing protein [Nannocystis bainbridge]
MPAERSIVHVELRADGTIARYDVPSGQHTILAVHRPKVHTSEAPWTDYLPRSVLLLPRVGPRHPWAPVVAWLRHLQQHLDHGGLVVGHREAGEPEEFAEVRARALLHFLRDEQSAWVALASKHGRVQDTQVYLDYLQRVCGWNTAVPAISDVADAATARAVEAFQRTYNRAFRADIFEDGVIGEQTLGALFEVAKAELVHWLELNDTSLDAMRFHEADGVLAVDPAFDGRRWTQLLAIPASDRYDLLREPVGAGLYPIARLLPLPVAEARGPTHHVLEIRVVDEWGEPLPHLAYELTVAHETRFGETDEHGLLAEPFMPPGDVTLRLADGAPVLFHDLYQPRRVFPLSAGDDGIHDFEAEYHARDDDDDDDDGDTDELDELEEDDEVWDALADEQVPAG